MKKCLTVIVILILAGAGFAQRVWSADKQYLMDAVSVSGLLEAEASYSDPDDGGESSDITLSTMELGLDAALSDYVSGHVLFLREEDDTDPVEMDEGYITLSGGLGSQYRLQAGRFYVPFGNFDTAFVSDPLTLELGETRENSVLGGYSAEFMALSAGVFNGDIDESGETDDHVEHFFGAADFRLPGQALPGVGITFGISYISSIADSDGLSEQNDFNDDGDPVGIEDTVGGVSAYISASALERFFLELEYLAATSDFATGDLTDITGSAHPRAWHVELAGLIAGSVGAGIQYAGTEDCGGFLPEKRYGAVFFVEPFENTWFGVEYLLDEYENNDESDTATAQLACEF
ncbi:MAG: LbtU family siderophore porin [Desulfobacteraceae bacterium]|nr:LbtU family siderophore porin [Desulfobacteraceae bacterium]